MHYDAMIAAVRVDDPAKLADTIAAHLVIGVDEKQHLLEIAVGPRATQSNRHDPRDSRWTSFRSTGGSSRA